MIKNLIYPFLFLMLLLSFSCNKTFEKNQQNLMFSDFHSREMPLDSIKNLGEMLEYFDKIYCENGETNWPVLYVNLKKQSLVEARTGGNILKIGIEPTPCPGLKFEYDFKCILEIVKDGYNIEVEGQRTESDSLGSFVKKHYFNLEKDTMYPLSAEQNGIWICALKKEKLSDLAPIISTVVKGYLEAAKNYSQIVFKKEIEDLNEQELEVLKRKLPFRLAFKFTDEVVPILNVG